MESFTNQITALAQKGMGQLNPSALVAVVQFLATSINIEEVSATSKTLALTDAGKLLYTTAGTDATITIPANVTVAFPIGTCISIHKGGVGNAIVQAASGVYINNALAGSVTVSSWGSGKKCVKVGTNTWLAF